MSKGKTENRRHFRKEMLIPIVVILFFVIMFAVTCTGPKEVATAEQVWSAIEQAGYQPVDATELYREDMPGLCNVLLLKKMMNTLTFTFSRKSKMQWTCMDT